MEQYLISDKESKSIPHIDAGFKGMAFANGVLVCRGHVEALIMEKCPCPNVDLVRVYTCCPRL